MRTYIKSQSTQLLIFLLSKFVMEYHRSAPISYFNLPLFLYYFPPSSEFQCFAYISGLTCPKAVILWYLCCPLPCLYFIFDHVIWLLHVTVTDFPSCDWLCTVSSLLSSLHHILMAGTACHCLLMIDKACHHLFMAGTAYSDFTLPHWCLYIYLLMQLFCNNNHLHIIECILTINHHHLYSIDYCLSCDHPSKSFICILVTVPTPVYKYTTVQEIG